MNKKQKFENFLENLKGNGQDTLIENVKKGFQACYESEWSDIVEPDEADKYHNFPQKFKAIGSMHLTNTGGVEVQISPDGDYARYRYTGGEISKWREVHGSNPDDPDSDAGIFDDNNNYLDFSEFMQVAYD